MTSSVQSHQARPRLEAAVTAGAVAALLAAVNGAESGYFERSWGWIAAVLLWVAAVALVVVDRPPVAPFPALFALAATAFVAWVAASALWSESPARALREVERDVVYVALALSVAALGGRLRGAALVAGVYAGGLAVTLYALATRLVPERLGTYDPFAEYRLSEPVGYWNALGLLVGMTLVLGAGIVAQTRAQTALRGLVAASLVPTSVALYFTFSRGAWVALAAGLVAALVLEPRRLAWLAWLVVLAPLPAAAVVLASRQDALTVARSPLDAATREGHRLAVLLVVLALLQLALTAVAVPVSRRVRVGRWVDQRLTVVGAVLIVLAAAGALFVAGGPGHVAGELREAFSAPPLTPRDLNERLFSLSGNNRSSVWNVTVDMTRADPATGMGAGMFEVAWLRERPIELDLRDAHSLYLEVLAELGVVGLLLLTAMLAVPLLAAWRARRRPLVSAAFGAYAGFVVHAAYDWDWEMVGLTMAALLCAAAIMVEAPARLRRLPAAGRVAVVALVLALSVFALASRVGNEALARARDQLADGEAGRALRNGRLAERVLPWSVEPLEIVGSAQLRLGAAAAGRQTLRRAAERDPSDWSAWYRLARSTSGAERQAAERRARMLNPRASILAEDP